MGNKSINHKRYFWPISLVISFTIILIGILALSIKKYKVYISNKNMVQEINITLENPQSNNFNNEIHNTPILGKKESWIVFLITLSLAVAFVFPQFVMDLQKSYNIYWHRVYLTLLLEFLSCVIWPAYIISKKKVLRTYLWNEMKNAIYIDE